MVIGNHVQIPVVGRDAGVDQYTAAGLERQDAAIAPRVVGNNIGQGIECDIGTRLQGHIGAGIENGDDLRRRDRDAGARVVPIKVGAQGQAARTTRSAGVQANPAAVGEALAGRILVFYQNARTIVDKRRERCPETDLTVIARNHTANATGCRANGIGTTARGK